MDGELLRRAAALWIELAGGAARFPPPGGATVLVAPASRLCPPGWSGVVGLGGAALVTVPVQELAAPLLGRSPGELTDLGWLRGRLDVAQVLGPARLAYLAAARFTPVPGPPVERLGAGDPDLLALAAAAGPQDAAEAGLDEITSPAFALREAGRVLAACGYRHWPRQTAQLSVLTDPGHRGRGLAGVVASAAVAEALADGLLPQWRARGAASLQVARRLGFETLGMQVSLLARSTGRVEQPGNRP